MATKTVTKKSTDTAASAPVAKAVRTFKANDLIPVRSITQGELLLPGKKSGILYTWAAYGDITEVEYQDLYTLKASRSGYIYTPFFIIEDEDLMTDPRWKDIAALYENMYKTEDLSQILRLPITQFKKALKQSPAGLRDAIKIEVATRIEAGTFDSIAKIKAVDEICGTDLLTTAVG